MKKTLFPVLAAALVMTACGTKTTEQTATPNRQKMAGHMTL